MRMGAFAASLILTGSASIVHPAQNPDSTIVELDRMVVRGKRAAVMSGDRLDSTILSRPRDSRTVDGMLVDLAGVDVKRSSPAAGRGRAVTLRGFDESRFLIVLDGRPLNGSGVMGGHYVDWSSLSTDNLQAIEVIRGPASAEYGNSLGGVVSIVTRSGRTLPEKTTISASYGVVAPHEPLDARENAKAGIALAHHANVGEILSLDLYVAHDRGTPFLRNNYYRVTNLGGTAALYLPHSIELGTAIRRSIQRRGFAIANHPGDPFYDKRYPASDGSGGGGPGFRPAGLTYPDTVHHPDSVKYYDYGDRSHWHNVRTQTDVSLKKAWDGLILSARLFLNNQNRTEYFYAIDDTNTLIFERFTRPEDNTWGWNLKANQTVGTQHRLRYGLEGVSLRYGNADIRHIDRAYFAKMHDDGSPEETIRAADRYGAYLQTELFFGERVELTPGLRYDLYLGNKRDETVEETPLQGVSPNAGIALGAWKGGEVAILGAYRYRFPTCPELYWYYGGHSFPGRKALSPERAIQVELGVSQGLSAPDKLDATLGLRGYHYIVEDYLRTVFGGRVPPSSPLNPKASRLIYNIDQATLSGIEVEATVRLAASLTIRANYTYQITGKSGDDFDSSTTFSDRLPELPEHKANAGVEYGWRSGATAGLSMRLVGEREVIGSSFTTGGATFEHVEPFVTFRLFGSYPVLSREGVSATLKVGVDNLFNADYEEEPGIPMPGITTTAGVEVGF
jgi:iron complex outermembrane receptor protein